MRFLVITLISLLLTSCIETGKWTAFVYPDIENIPNAGDVQDYIYGEFDNFDSCQSAAMNRLDQIYRETNKYGDYQCGYKCSYKEKYGNLLICKETKK